MLRTFWRLVLGVLLGIMVGVSLISTQTVFGLKTEVGLTSYQAGSLAGGMLEKVDWAVLCGSTLLVAASLLPGIQILRSKAGKLAFCALLCVVVLEVLELTLLTPAVHQMRDEIMRTFGSFEAADQQARGRFWMVHGVSMIRAMVEMIMLAVAFLAESRANPSSQNS